MNFSFVCLKYNFFTNFCASPFGKDKNNKSTLFQSTELILDMFGKFF